MFKFNPFTNSLDLVNPPGVTDHGALTGLSNDDHTQYGLLAGRATPQVFAFGSGSGATAGNLTSTSHATKGHYHLDSAGAIRVDEANNVFAISNKGRFGAFAKAASSSYQFGSTINDQASADYRYLQVDPAFRPTNDVTKSYFGLFMEGTLSDADATGNLTGGSQNYNGARFRWTNNNATRTVSTVNAGSFVFRQSGAATTTTAVAGHFDISAAGGTITNAQLIQLTNPTGSGAITTLTGLRIPDLTKGSTNYGIYLEGTSGLARQGIHWNGDTNLYRSAADNLKTDDTFDAAAYKVAGSAGADGSFTTVDGKTVTVVKGLITSIV